VKELHPTCIVPGGEDGPVRIYLHFADVAALPDLGYAAIPELYCESTW